ncbi:MAG: hypothetical protein RLZZ385_471 [Pseudomonadota bacterium]|jgi:pantoate--beta-alanine ligase
MLTVIDVNSLRESVAARRSKGLRIGLVPTMGNLHDGHLSLVQQAKSRCDFVITSIFVNPMQFGANEDLAAYPNTPEQDADLLSGAGCDCLFRPPKSEVYPDGTQNHTVVSVPKLGDDYCGRSRPGHFEGVATVVTKLFNMALPDEAFFGLKDYQQFLIIKKLTRDLAFPVQIIAGETKREPSGLAMSSRNSYLTAIQRIDAAALYKTLTECMEKILSGNRDFAGLETAALRQLQAHGLRPDYFAICNANTLVKATQSDSALVVLAAAYLGNTRLIDNVRFDIDQLPAR